MKIIKISILILSILSCSTYKHVPKINYIDKYNLGSILKFKHLKNEKYMELIACDQDGFYVLDVNTNLTKENLRYYLKSEIYNIRLIYAKGPNYSLSIVGFPLFTISHGFFLGITAPLNVVLTSIITYTGKNHNTIKYKGYNIDEICSFARFPAGLPENLKLEDIKK